MNSEYRLAAINLKFIREADTIIIISSLFIINLEKAIKKSILLYGFFAYSPASGYSSLFCANWLSWRVKKSVRGGRNLSLWLSPVKKVRGSRIVSHDHIRSSTCK